MMPVHKMTPAPNAIGFTAPIFVNNVPLLSRFPKSTCSPRSNLLRASASGEDGSVKEARTNLSRRAFMSVLASIPLVATLKRDVARSENLSGQLTVYKDLPKGFTIFRPSGWNEFEALQDNYDMKWQDVIQPLEFVTVLTTPLPKERRLADLGDAQAVGTKLAQSRSGELVSASEKDIDGSPAYVFEIKREQAHQLTLLTVGKMKLYSVNASCSERRWPRREKLLRAVVDSFKPKL